MNILIIRLSAMGDVIHALSVIAPLKKHYPQCKITWVIEEEAADLLKSYPGIDRVIVSRRKRWIRQIKGYQFMKAIRQASAFVKTLRSEEYDLVLDFQGLLKSGIILASFWPHFHKKTSSKLRTISYLTKQGSRTYIVCTIKGRRKHDNKNCNRKKSHQDRRTMEGIPHRRAIPSLKTQRHRTPIFRRIRPF
jgi:ADP-heptose:LPS heptosyltransferase